MLHWMFAALAIPQAPADQKIDFASLGQAFVAERCEGKPATPCALDAVLERHFARLVVGPFDVEVPHSMLDDKEGLQFVRDVALCLSVQVQEWATWQGAGTSFTPEMVQAVPAWSQRWKPVNAAAIAKAKSRDLRDVLATTDADRALLVAMEALCDDGAKFALVTPEKKNLHIVLVPTRLEFMRWIGYSGLLDESMKALNWWDDSAQWTQFWHGWTLVLALEYASWDGFDPSFKASQPMKKVGPTILAQHVVQQATLGLLRACRPTVAEGRWEGALALLMTIDAVGEANTVEGAGGVGTSGAKTKPYSKFVPGGNPKGGTLPPRSAGGLSVIVESRWRKGHGSDGFVVPLKQGQQDGVTAAKGQDGVDPLATFVLRMEDNSGKHLVHAPFFGPHADDQEYPPGDYLVDFAEFYRAYKTGFFHWLEHVGPDPATTQAKWNELVRGIPTLSADLSFDALAARVYGLPISAKDGTTDSLEWRFLKYVAAAKTK
ncbi:MAG: hypothetical protein IPK67_05330 [Planctomycetes bacterium]|nr:hypothetical protein [Planctomycetota bacterium]